MTTDDIFEIKELAIDSNWTRLVEHTAFQLYLRNITYLYFMLGQCPLDPGF